MRARLNRWLSGDWPRSRVLGVALLVMLLGLGLAPWLFPSVKAVNVAAKILIFIVLVASYDLLLGYTGIVSFAHTMFFGLGAYGVAIAMNAQPTAQNLVLGVLCALVLSTVLALLIGLFSLRVRAIFFAMITLAVASAFMTLASQLSEITGGEDGLTFSLPLWLSPSFEWSEEPLALPWGEVDLNGRLAAYYLLFTSAVVLFLIMLRWVNSPFGRVLQAIRENEFRAEALGYPVVIYRTLATMLSAMMATLAGCMLAIWLRYNGPDTSLSFEIMLDVLLMVVIGGMGTLYGAVVGSGVFLLAQSYLQDVLAALANLTSAWPWLSALFTPNRWLLWLGLMFVLSVYHFPTGIVGVLRQRAQRVHAQVGKVDSSKP